MTHLPLKLGDAHGVVAEIALDRDGLEWLAYQCPNGDGFTDDLHRALVTVDEEIATRTREREEGLGLFIEIIGIRR